MRITIISDTHGFYPTLQGGDILIHCGDAFNRNNHSELVKFIDWFSSQNYNTKIYIAGNHDGLLFSTFSKNLIIENNIVYLEDNLVKINGLRIYGSPWTPAFMNWYFMKDRGKDIAEVWFNIPENLDILVTHGPPMGILDWSIYSNGHVGCADLLERVLAVKPKIHCFGHIHACYGKFQDLNTLFINAALLNEQYQLVNDPIDIYL
jgi:Icc-related predicted phosphoesterase